MYLKPIRDIKKPSSTEKLFGWGWNGLTLGWAMKVQRRSQQRNTAAGLLDQQVVHRFSRFSVAYRTRLLKGLQDLQSYCTEEIGCRLLPALQQPRIADRLLGQYVMDRHSVKSRVHRSVVKHALLGRQHLVPALRRHLHSAWENMRVWEEQISTKVKTSHSNSLVVFNGWPRPSTWLGKA